MASRSEIAAVYLAGVVQGVALVTFPAASSIFTSPSEYALSNEAYGSLFLPQAVLAVVASLLGAGLTGRMGIKRVYLLGLGANLLSMVILLSSRSFEADYTLAYGALLSATGCLGVGFGLTVPSLNSFAAASFPRTTDRAVLMMNAVLGFGTVLAPVFVAIFLGLGMWTALPLLVAALLLALLFISMALPLIVEGGPAPSTGVRNQVSIPARYWVFALMAVLYGIVETLSGNWGTLYAANVLGAGPTVASLCLALFWGMVTAGRILFALVAPLFSERRTYHLLPFVAAASCALIALLVPGASYAAVAAFALSGLGCSALLPLTISFGQKELTALSSSVAGGLIAFYQIGYGIAAFGVPPLEAATGISLHTVYGQAAIVALLMAGITFVITPWSETKSRR